MKEVILIRHGMTAGNREHRYVGTTDELLCEEGLLQLQEKQFPEADENTLILSSPMKRCLETARRIWPGCTPVVVEDFRECDFGRFEYKNYSELSNDPAYQAWIDSGGTLPFPEGESPDAFRERCCCAFRNVMEHYRDTSRLILSVHGGTIMAILSAYAWPRRDYFDWQAGSLEGYRCSVAASGLILTVEAAL